MTVAECALWSYVFSKRWDEHTSLRVCDSVTVYHLLAELEKLSASDQLIAVSTTYFDTVKQQVR